jgi:predicted O-methyltransferase YrrM
VTAVGIEIGVFNGTCSCWLLDNILTHKDSKLYCVDINENEIWKLNTNPYKDKTILKLGYSSDILRKLIHDNTEKSFADFVFC